MSEIQKSGVHIKLDKLKILLPGIPSRSSRGWFGYCTVILFPLANSWALFDTGHTPGCLAMFYQQQTTAAVCGDVIKNGWEALTGKAGSAGVDDQKTAENVEYISNRAEVIIPGHDRPFIFKDNGLEYLTDGAWQVQGNFFPRPQNEVLLNINMKGGYFKVP